MTSISQQITRNIVQTAIAAGEFKTLVQAVQAAGLMDTLSTGGPFTVFAPTDEAFRKLPTGTLEGLMKDLPKLKSILTYHVVDRKINAAEVHDMTTDGRTPNVTTLEGAAVVLKTQGMLQRNEYVNNAKITKAGIETSNGVIHVIDSVLTPPQ